MLRKLILFLLVVISITSLQAKDNLKTQISTFNDSVKQPGTLDYVKNCASCATTNSQSNFSREKSSVYSAINNKKIELTLLTEQEASQVFKTLKDDEDNSFNYPLDGCYARAHLMASRMDDMGIISGKAFVEGDLYVSTTIGEAHWSYHVASLVLMKVNGVNVPTVIDPGMFDKPVSFEVWKKKLLSDKRASLKKEFYTSRFNYDPGSLHNNMNDYLEEDVQDMKEATKSNRVMGEVMERLYR
jgi:hypothetical protein